MMIVTHLTCRTNGTCRITVEYRDGESYGEEYIDLKLGEGIGQYTYAELRTHGSGFIDIDFNVQPEPLRQAA